MKFEYTTLAYRYASRFPMFTYVSTQINFWIIANILLVTIMHLQSRIISYNYQMPAAGRFWTPLLIGIILGILYGVMLGVTGYYLDRKFLRRMPLGKILVLKSIISLAVLLLIMFLLRYAFYDSLINPSLDIPGASMHQESWKVLFWLLVIYYSVMTLVISFINQENRIFMFMDLKSSTTTAEKLGHLKYSSFISSCFSDINEVLYPFRAQVYQYVGDEIVVTWPESEGIKEHFCLEFYFACRRQFERRAEYYMANFGLLPHFKAGVHSGKVTTVEIGEVKRDIAYHGDTLNTAARMQSVCNDYGKNLITSRILFDKVGTHPNMQTQDLGMILLKGKMTQVELVSVDWID
jgi:adenylate cyclase